MILSLLLMQERWLSTLKQIAIKMGLIVGIPKPDMIIALRNAMLRATELKVIEATKRDGTYVVDKNTVPRLANLVLRYPDALQRPSALATQQTHFFGYLFQRRQLEN